MTISRYQAIWNVVKEKKRTKVAAPAEAHRRLKRAIIKRKDLDISYKYLMSEANQKATLEFVSSGNILEITLHIKIRSDWI